MPLLIAQQTALITYLPLAAFGMFAALAWLGLEWMASKRPRAEQRLDEIRDPSRRRRAEKQSAPSVRELFQRVLAKASAFSKPLQPKSETEQGQLRLKLAHGGFRSESAATIFLGLKFIGLLIGFALGGGFVLLSGFNQSAMIRAGLLAGVSFYIPDIVLFLLVRHRKEAIFLGLPDALDLMVVCVEAGLGLDQAMRRVSDEMKKSHAVIAEEFGLCNLQLQMGRPRAQVLQDLGKRTGVDDLRALASILIQADKFGSSIGQALRVQSDSMRTRRRQIAEEKAAKTAVKLIFPLVLFIFPGIFVVLVGPAAIIMVREMFPAMGGGN